MGTPDALLHCFMDLGEAMLTVGADVNRVEDTLIRMGMAYGAARMNVFVITSSMVVTMTLPDGRDVTQTRRVPSPGGTDMTEIKALTQGGVRPLWAYCGSMLAAGSCTLFFGGTPADGLSAALFGLAICYLQRHFSPACPNRMVFNLLSSMAVGVSIILWVHFLPGLQLDKISIGDIMLLIPGMAMTNAVRDTMIGSPIAGAMRLIETLLWAAALALGFMSAFWLTGGIGL